VLSCVASPFHVVLGHKKVCFHKSCSKKDRTFAIRILFYNILSTVPVKVVPSIGDTPFPTFLPLLECFLERTFCDGVGLIGRTACARAQLSGCSSTINVHSETEQIAVCCQNLPLGALNSRSAPSLLVGELFKKFGIFLNTGLYCPPRKYTNLWTSLCARYNGRSRVLQKPMATNTSLRSGRLPRLVRVFDQ
jgi:hypothetical protein